MTGQMGETGAVLRRRSRHDPTPGPTVIVGRDAAGEEASSTRLPAR